MADTVDWGVQDHVGLAPVSLDSFVNPHEVSRVFEEATRPLVAPKHSRRALATKRCLDVIAAILLIVVTAPLMVGIALAVRVSSRGPVLFRHNRVGKDGVVFTMWKFRSMRADTTRRINADPELRRLYEQSAFKLPADSSFITPVGRVIRKTSLDELPQLVHVLTGKMSMVGVRPIEPDEFAGRTEDERAGYVAMAPGLTGPWQVSGRSAISYGERCAMDRDYATEWSLGDDIATILKTPRSVLRFGTTR